MYELTFVWCLLFAKVNARQTLNSSKDCEIMTPDGRDIPGPLNDFPAIRLNLFPNLTIPRSGRLKNITYYAVREGTFYISFWEPLGNHTFELVTKIPVTSEREGLQGSEPESYYVEEGNILAIHYNNDTTEGVVDYERSDRPNRTPGIPLYPVYNPNWQDDGWLNGTVLNLAGTLIRETKNVALHITICGCVNNTFGEACESCSDNCLGNTCNKETGAYDQGCLEGLQGPQCNIDINECEIDPEVCIHGGRCENTHGDFLCHCRDQWTGPTCAKDIDECEGSNLCYNGGICHNTAGGFLCNYTTGWSDNNGKGDNKNVSSDKEVKCNNNIGFMVALVVVSVIALVLGGSTTALAILLHRTLQSKDMSSDEEMQMKT